MSNCASISFLVVFTPVCVALEDQAKIEQLIREVIGTKESHRATTSYRSLFAAAGTNGLPALRCSEYASIAIQAAWEEVTRTVPEKDGPQVYRPDKEKLGWFLGFLEGRANVNAPNWWAEVVLDARANRRNNIYPGQPTRDPYHNAGLEFVNCPHDTTVRKTGDGYVLSIGTDSITLPDEILQKSDDGNLFCGISGCFTPKHFFVAVHDNVGYPHEVACIDRTSGKLIWKAKACGCFWGFATGRHQSWVTVIAREDRVFVFGAASVGFYVHAFRSDNGNTIFRFSSDF